MKTFIRQAFFFLIIRPFVLIFIGLNVRNKEKLPNEGPAIVIANHNSHLDALVLLSLFKFSVLPDVRPAAAADFFLKNKLLSFFSLNIIGILPVDRKCKNRKPLQTVEDALQNGKIVILFPEGTRGKPEEFSVFKNGVWHLAKKFRDVPVIPVYMHGLGKALPKGEAVFVPCFCDIFIGDSVPFIEDRKRYMTNIKAFFERLAPKFEDDIWWGFPGVVPKVAIFFIF